MDCKNEINENQNSESLNTNEEFPFDPYAGGRYLNAISENPNLNSMQKLLMLTIGAQLDFRNLAESERFISQAKLAELMSCTREAVNRIVKGLVTSGYLTSQQRFKENKQLSNMYALSAKVFLEYAKMPRCDRRSQGGVIVDHTELPNKNSLTKKKDNTIVLSKKNPERSHERVQEKKKAEPKPRKQNQSWEKREARKMALRLFKPNYIPGKYRHDPGTAAIYAMIDDMYKRHGYEPIKVFYDDAAANNRLGELPFIQRMFEETLQQIKSDLEEQKSQSYDEESRRLIDEIPF